jgi:4-hydroxybenzoate polyprenyltransferase
MTTLRKYASFIKLEHTLFSLPLIFSGALIPRGEWPSVSTTLLIVLAGASARVVAMALNRIIDRRIDGINPRTRERHLASGAMKVWEAWVYVALSLAAYLLAAWSISSFCLRWSWVPLVGFVVYPYFKRFTKWTHLGLGFVWALVPAGGFLAVQPSLANAGPLLLLSVFCVFWLAGFDIIYATLDEDFDRQAGIYSLPACWGSQRALKTAALFHFLAFLALLLLYFIWFSGTITVMLLMVIGVLLYLEQQFSHYVDLAFFQINALAGFVVLFFVWSGVKGV